MKMRPWHGHGLIHIYQYDTMTALHPYGDDSPQDILLRPGCAAFRQSCETSAKSPFLSPAACCIGKVLIDLAPLSCNFNLNHCITDIVICQYVLSETCSLFELWQGKILRFRTGFALPYCNVLSSYAVSPPQSRSATAPPQRGEAIAFNSRCLSPYPLGFDR